MAQQACIYYRRGSCRYGDACKFSHSDVAPLPICSWFKAGRCRNGNNCLFAHVMPPTSRKKHKGGGPRWPAAPAPAQAAQSLPTGATGAAAGAAAAAGDLDSSPPPLGEDSRPSMDDLCRCSACGWQAQGAGSGRGPAGLLAHLQEQHPNRPQLAEQLQAYRQCPHCKKVLKSFEGLSAHVYDVHLQKAQGVGGQPPSRPPAGFGHQGWDYGNSDGSYEDEWEEQGDSWGFTRDEVNELLCQGVKPWEEDAWDVLEFLQNPY